MFAIQHTDRTFAILNAQRTAIIQHGTKPQATKLSGSELLQFVAVRSRRFPDATWLGYRVVTVEGSKS